MRNYIIAGLLLASSLLLGFHNQVEQAVPYAISWVAPGATAQLEGTTLLMVHEKIAPPIAEILVVRAGPEIVAAKKLAGFLEVDKDDVPFVTPFTEYAATKKISVPYFAYVSTKHKNKVVKVMPWPASVEGAMK